MADPQVDSDVSQLLRSIAREVPALAEPHASVLRKLKHLLPRKMTVQQIRRVTPEEFRALPGVGERFMERFIALRRDIDRLVGDADDSVLQDPPVPEEAEQKVRLSAAERAKLSRYTLNAAGLERRVAQELLRLGANLPTPLRLIHLVALDPAALPRLPGVGELRLSALCRLRQAALDAAEELRDDREIAPGEHAWAVRVDGPEWPLEVLDQCLAEDLVAYVERLTDNLRAVVAPVLGVGCPAVVPNDLVTKLGVSRQRISQLYYKGLELLPHALRAHPESTWPQLLALRGRDLTRCLPQLRQAVGSEDAFYAALSHLSGRLRREVEAQLRQPAERFLDLELFADLHANTIGPVARVEYVVHLTDVLDVDIVEAEGYVERLVQRGDLEPVPGGLLPRALMPKVAIARLLFEQVGSVAWEEIIAQVNASGTVRKPLIPHHFGRYSDHNRWIYLAGRGRFRHVARLDLDEATIDAVLEQVCVALKAGGTTRRNLAVLYSQLEFDKRLDYYAVRYIVRDHGARRGLSFVGRSRVDTVSLEDADAGVPLIQEVLRHMRRTRQPMRRGDLAALLPMHSEESLTNQLKQLEVDGVVMRLDRGEYALSEDVRARFDLEAILEAIGALVAAAERPLYVVRLHELLRQDDGPSVPLGLLGDLIDRGAREGRWYTAAGIASREPLPFSSIGELSRLVLADAGRDPDQILAGYARRVDAPRTRMATWMWIALNRPTRRS